MTAGVGNNLATELAKFKDPHLARELVRAIHAFAPEKGATLMEVCGTHTVAIARAGIRDLMPGGTKLASGPGCPVCVTCNRDIDTVIALARVPGVTIATFGDMTRVPGSTSSLLAEQAAGASINIVYSPLDALALAQKQMNRQGKMVIRNTKPEIMEVFDVTGAGDTVAAVLTLGLAAGLKTAEETTRTAHERRKTTERTQDRPSEC